MGIWDGIKTTGRSIFNTIKQPLRGLWSGIKSVDSLISNPIVQTSISVAQPETAPLFAGYDLAKYISGKLGGNYIAEQLDDL